MTQIKRGFLGVLFSMALTAVSSCGGGSGSCGKVAPCGGDVVGNYNITSACLTLSSMDMPLEGCPGATVNTSGIRVSGSASFNADMTYTLNETISASASETIPASCLTMNGITLTCQQLDQAIQQLVTENPGVFQSAHCSGASSCICSFTLAPVTTNDSGTYTTSGTTLTLSGGGGGEYCVQGNELHLISIDMTMPMATMNGDIVLTKK